MKQQMSRKNRGFTLTEAAIVLGIVGLILGAIWVAAGSVYSNMRVNTTSSQIIQMVSGIRSLYAGSTLVDFPASSQLNLAKAGAIPKDLVDNPTTPTTVTDVWGGNITISPNNAGGAARSGFSITMSLVPQDACVGLLVRLTGQGRDAGLYSANGQTSFPVSMTTALTNCTSPEGDMTLVFKLRA
jgi:type II secretory pathway pseudopilin PulG